MTGTPQYVSWLGMKWRCSPNNKASRKYYFERGIRVCTRWRGSFENFLSDMPPYPGGETRWTVERIDNDGNYRPGNFEWTTQADQNGNRGPFRPRVA
jgi:hypothetical protein